MKYLTAAALALILLANAPAFAGGPVIIEENYEVADESANRKDWIVPVILGAIVLCAIACGSDDAPPAVVPGPVCNDQSGC